MLIRDNQCFEKKNIPHFLTPILCSVPLIYQLFEIVYGSVKYEGLLLILQKIHVIWEWINGHICFSCDVFTDPLVKAPWKFGYARVITPLILAAIFQTIFSNAMNENIRISINISLKFVTKGWRYSSLGSDNGLAPSRRQAIIRIKGG